MTELTVEELRLMHTLVARTAIHPVHDALSAKLSVMIAERRPPAVSFELPLRLASLVNRTEHWTQHAKRAKTQRGLVAQSVATRISRGAKLQRVHITRLGPGRLDPDGLVISAKHVVDGIADAFGVNDRDISVSYAQLRQKAWGVRIELWA